MARAKKEAALTPEERLQAALVPDWEWPYKLRLGSLLVGSELFKGFRFHFS